MVLPDDDLSRDFFFSSSLSVTFETGSEYSSVYSLDDLILEVLSDYLTYDFKLDLTDFLLPFDF